MTNNPLKNAQELVMTSKTANRILYYAVIICMFLLAIFLLLCTGCALKKPPDTYAVPSWDEVQKRVALSVVYHELTGGEVYLEEDLRWAIQHLDSDVARCEGESLKRCYRVWWREVRND